MPALLSRLNDPNKDVREHAIRALGLLKLSEKAKDDDVEIWSQLMKEVLKTIALHLHDSDLKTRDQLLGGLESNLLDGRVC